MIVNQLAQRGHHRIAPIGSLANLAGTRLPALSKAKERARRIVCVKNLKQLALRTIMYADDHGDWLPYGGTFFPHWYSREFREGYRRDYGLQRASFYCPSNPKWNRDDFWDWPDGINSVLGYLYYAGNEEFNQLRELHPDPGVFTNQPVFAQRSTQNPHYRILFADMTRQVDKTWGRPGDPDPLLRGVNHFNRAGRRKWRSAERSVFELRRRHGRGASMAALGPGGSERLLTSCFSVTAV